MIEKLPFAFTVPIVRYLEEMQGKYLNENAGQTSEETDSTFTFNTYIDSEPFYENYEVFRAEFVNYLEKKGVGKFIKVPSNSMHFRVTKNIGLPDEVVAFDEIFKFKIVNIEPVHGLLEIYRKNKTVELGQNTSSCKIKRLDGDKFGITDGESFYISNNVVRSKILEKIWSVREHWCDGKKVHGTILTLSREKLAREIGVKNDSSFFEDIKNLKYYLEKKFKGAITVNNTVGSVSLEIHE